MKRISIISSIICAALLLLAACDGMDASMEKYLGDGPIIYVGKVDSLKVYAGKEQAKLTWAASGDSRIKGALIYWNNRSGMKEVEWNPSEPFETIIEGLSEGSVLFEVLTKDAYGNVSVPVSISGNVYGDSFASLLDNPATITSGFYNETSKSIDITVKHSSNFYYSAIKVDYKDLEDNIKSVVIEKSQESATLEGVSSPDIYYSSLFSPEENSIDLYSSESVLYEDLANPYCQMEDPNVVLNGLEGSISSAVFSANRAPVEAVTEDSWMKVRVEGKKVYIEASETNSSDIREGTVTLKAGTFELPIKVRQIKNLIGTAYGTEGVIFWQDPEDYSKYKIISAQRGNCKWSTEEYIVGVNQATYQLAAANASKWVSATGFSSLDGVMTDNNIIIANRVAQVPAGTYPAYEWCKALGEGWYLPSAVELLNVFEVYNGTTFDGATAAAPSKLTDAEKASRKRFDDLLVSIGGEKLNTQAETAAGDWVWDNMEEANAAGAKKACGFRFGNRGHGARAKTTDANSSDKFYTRAVKVVTVNQLQ